MHKPPPMESSHICTCDTRRLTALRGLHIISTLHCTPTTLHHTTHCTTLPSHAFTPTVNTLFICCPLPYQVILSIFPLAPSTETYYTEQFRRSVQKHLWPMHEAHLLFAVKSISFSGSFCLHTQTTQYSLLFKNTKGTCREKSSWKATILHQMDQVQPYSIILYPLLQLLFTYRISIGWLPKFVPQESLESKKV